MAAEEQLVLDGLTLNDATFGLMELQCPPPRQRREWIGAADSEWQALVRDPLHENREITIKIGITPQSTTALAMDKIGLVVDKLRLASRTQAGIELVWTPADGARVVTFDVLAGEIVDMPIDWEQGWFIKAPTIQIQMTAKPYWRATEITTTTASSSTPFVTMEVANVPGDIPALGRLIVTDTATQNRRHVEWGLENQYYNASTSLLIDSDDMVVSGFSGSQTTATGAYDPNATGNSVITSTITQDITAVAGTGNLSHIGTFRVKGRVNHATSTVNKEMEVRFAYRSADGPWSTSEWTLLNQTFTSVWEEIDLGSITVPPVLAGTQRWTGRVEARIAAGAATSQDTLRLDYLRFFPTGEGYGKARGTVPSSAGVLVDFDQFTSTTSGSALNATTSDSGDTWATSGSTTDFAFTDDYGGESIKRSTTADSGDGRFAVLGSATPTDVTVEVAMWADALPSATLGHAYEQTVIARWTDSSNCLLGTIRRERTATGVSHRMYLNGRVAAATVISISGSPSIAGAQINTWYVLQLSVYASGRVLFRLMNLAKTTTHAILETTATQLATGGTLASGKSGFHDYSGSTGVNRYYDNFATFTPTPEPVVIYSGRNMQFRHDETIRQDSTGTYTGRPESYRGSRFLVPVGTSRVAVAARRNDIEEADATNVTDATQIQVAYTPRGLAVPRFG